MNSVIPLLRYIMSPSSHVYSTEDASIIQYIDRASTHNYVIQLSSPNIPTEDAHSSQPIHIAAMSCNSGNACTHTLGCQTLSMLPGSSCFALHVLVKLDPSSLLASTDMVILFVVRPFSN
mmetsp:Transcript_6547/g.13884  ORF Transcript_6547/g.13884 Transcript_6547/m.13884 type:complete len:120 (+) Transcript_6547:20-379(+)